MKYPYYLALITSLAALTGCDQVQNNDSQKHRLPQVLLSPQ